MVASPPPPEVESDGGGNLRRRLRWLLGLGWDLEGSFLGRGLFWFRVLGRARACGEKRMGMVDAIVAAPSDEIEPDEREREREKRLSDG